MMTHLPVAITKVRRYEEAVFTADGHQLQSFRPAFNDHIQWESGRLTAFYRAVEHRSIDQGTMVVTGDLVAGGRFVSRTLRYYFILQTAGQRHHTLFFLIRFQEFLSRF